MKLSEGVQSYTDYPIALPSVSQLQTVYCLEYLKAHEGGAILADAEAATNNMHPLLSSSEPGRRHSKHYHFPKKNNF